jgi:FMN-dependent NADH-azoreductase
MSLFRLDASIRIEGSHSRAIADIVEATWRDDNPDAAITRRSIGIDPLPSTTWALAVGAGRTPEAERTVEQREALAIAATLADELLEADALLFAVPLYNFGVSQHFKTWVDIAITDPRVTPGLAGKPAVLAMIRGGAYGAGTPREGWDHATGWIRRILEDVWSLDLKVVEKEFALVGVNPALDEFKELAAQMAVEAEALAAEHGRHLSKVSVRYVVCSHRARGDECASF